MIIFLNGLLFWSKHLLSLFHKFLFGFVPPNEIDLFQSGKYRICLINIFVGETLVASSRPPLVPLNWAILFKFSERLFPAALFEIEKGATMPTTWFLSKISR